MPISDIASNLEPLYQDTLLFAVGESEKTSTAIDTAQYDIGVMMFPLVQLATVPADRFNFLRFEQSQVPGGPYSTVPTENIIGDPSLMTDLVDSVAPSFLPRLGVFGVERFIQVVFGSESATGSASIQIFWIVKNVNRPQAD